MFRSVDMSYLQLFLPAAVAEEFADQIAREGCMQFTDLNKNIQPFQRQFTGDIIKIQEIERQAKAIEELLDTYDIPHDTDVNGDDLHEMKRPPNATQIMPNIAKEISDLYQRLKEQANVEHQLRTELTSQKVCFVHVHVPYISPYILHTFMHGKTKKLLLNLNQFS